MFLAGRFGRRLESAEDKLETLSRQVRSLEMEWESTYNKLRSLLARLNKRDEREAAAPNVNNTNTVETGTGPRQWELAALAGRNGK